MFWTNLKAAIAAVIKANNNQEITGTILQSTLNSIVNSVGANATFVDIAMPTTNPGVPDGPVFYLASQAGMYVNFGNIELDYGLHVLLWNGTEWEAKSLFSNTLAFEVPIGYETLTNVTKSELLSRLNITEESLENLLNGAYERVKIKSGMMRIMLNLAVANSRIGDDSLKECYYGMVYTDWDAGEHGVTLLIEKNNTTYNFRLEQTS